jgi:hypothetical protein
MFLPFGGAKKTAAWPSFHDTGEDVFASPISRPATAPVKSPKQGQPNARHLALIDKEDYYNSYYSTLRSTPKAERQTYKR